MDLISKKDLLALTGISYGQLYRWKREGLIPEDWFIKQSSYTGQETFFPRQQILSRVQTILDAKDKYSLEELSRLLNPETAPEGFCTAEMLGQMPELSPALLPILNIVCPKESYEFFEVVVFAAVSQVMGRVALPPERTADLLGMALSAAKDFPALTEATLTLFREQDGERLHLLLYKSASPLALDRELEAVGYWDLGPIAANLKVKYQSRRN